MRTLSATLEAAQKSASAIPFVRVRAYDALASIARARFTSLYSGSEEDLPYGAAINAAGKLHRVRLFTTGIQNQIITTPGPTSNYATWTTRDTNPHVDIATAPFITLGYFLLARADAINHKVYYNYVIDTTGAWGSTNTLITDANIDANTHVAIAAKSDTNMLTIYSIAGRLYAKPYSSGFLPQVAGPTFTTITGISVVYAGDYNLIVTGSDATGPGVFQVIFGDGYSETAGVWSTPVAIHRSADGGPTTYAHPSLASADTWRATWLEIFAGPIAYTRAMITYTTAAEDFVNNRWREPSPVDWAPVNAPATLTANPTATYLWLTTPAKVWRAPLSSAATTITSAVISATTHESPLSARATIALDNATGAFLTAGATPLTPGMAVEIDLGYTTSAGDEVPASSALRLQVAAVHHTQGQGRAATVLECVSPWSILAAWTAPRQFKWAAAEQTYFGLLAFIVARCGYAITTRGSTSTMLSGDSPAFAIHPGTSALAAFRAILERLPEVAIIEGSTIYLIATAAADASTYALGTTHALRETDLADALAPAAHARAVGTGVSADAILEAQLELVPHRITILAAPEVTTAGTAQEVANGLLRKATIDTPAGKVTGPPHCGAQLWDVVAVTQASAGWSARKARVTAIDTTYNRATKPAYSQILTLGEV